MSSVSITLIFFVIWELIVLYTCHNVDGTLQMEVCTVLNRDSGLRDVHAEEVFRVNTYLGPHAVLPPLLVVAVAKVC